MTVEDQVAACESDDSGPTGAHEYREFLKAYRWVYSILNL